MIIWFAADIPHNSCGGVARSMHELSRGLALRGHDVTIITRKTTGSKNYITFALKLAQLFLLSGRKRPDWIIARSTDAVFCALLCALLRMKTCTILHNHGWEELVLSVEKKLPRRVVSSPTTWKSFLIRTPLLRLMINVCTLCMSGTLHEIRSLQQKYPRLRHKLAYLPNGTDVAKKGFWDTSDCLPPVFLCVGNLSWKKNIRYSIQLFQHIKKSRPDAHLYCIGTGVDERALQKHVDTTLEGITNIPAVSLDNMKEWYQKCPYMISSSRYEGGHPLAILEALSFGTIVFASPIASHKEILHNGRNGFLLCGSNQEQDAEIILHSLTQGISEERTHAVHTARRNLWRRQVCRLERILCTSR